MTDRWHTGNANDDGAPTRGWVVGNFIDPSQGVRSSQDVEVKWAHHAQGEERAGWTSDDQRTTLVMLIEGHFSVQSTEGAATFVKPGDYAMWGRASTTHGKPWTTQSYSPSAGPLLRLRSEPELGQVSPHRFGN